MVFLYEALMSGIVPIEVYALLFNVWAYRFHSLSIATASMIISSIYMYPALGQGDRWKLRISVHV
jgi:hypothetical protein